MASKETMTLRVILTEADIRKVKLTSKPGSVEELISCLKNNLRLDYNFTLQFQDPEFDNELCNLTILSELPQKPTVKIIPVIELVPLSSGEMETSSDMLSDAPSTADTVLTSELPQEKRMPWPDMFLTPKFSVDVEFRLCQANLLYLKDRTHLKVTKELKHDILQKLAETIYSCKAYPTTEDLRAVAKALVNTHPCLQEPGSPSGYCGWTNSLKDKIWAGCGQDASSLEMLRQQLVDEMKRKNPDAVFINQKMDMTLSLRIKDVVINKPPVSQILQRWPALFRESQVYQEFSQVVGKNLKQDFYGFLDRHCPQLIQIFRSKRGLAGQILSDLLQQARVCTFKLMPLFA
ncbi:uncharacterized protein LOC113645414 isoform X1 [Tachysurus ichikawai]